MIDTKVISDRNDNRTHGRWVMVGEDGLYEVRDCIGQLVADCPDRGTAEFIAATSVDVPALLAENAMLRAEAVRSAQTLASSKLSERGALALARTADERGREARERAEVWQSACCELDHQNETLQGIADAALADNARLTAEIDRHDEANADLERASRECVDDANRDRSAAERQNSTLRTELSRTRLELAFVDQREREARFEILQLQEEVARLQKFVTP